MKLVLGLFGLENFYGGDVKSYIEIAQMGEELGFDAVSVTDHVVMGKNLQISFWSISNAIRCTMVRTFNSFNDDRSKY